MSKVITFSRHFQKGHPKAGKPTYFVEKIYNALYSRNNLMDYPKALEIDDSILGVKKHTIRNGHRFKVGDTFSPRVWSGKPYASKQIVIAPDLEVKKVYDFEITNLGDYLVNNYIFYRDEMKEVALNDGLELDDFECWFPKGPFKGQVICWSDQVRY